MMFNPFLINYFWFPRIPQNCDKPPTIYAILESIVNFGKDCEDKEKIKDTFQRKVSFCYVEIIRT